MEFDPGAKDDDDISKVRDRLESFATGGPFRFGKDLEDDSLTALLHHPEKEEAASQLVVKTGAATSSWQHQKWWEKQLVLANAAPREVSGATCQSE